MQLVSRNYQVQFFSVFTIITLFVLTVKSQRYLLKRRMNGEQRKNNEIVRKRVIRMGNDFECKYTADGCTQPLHLVVNHSVKEARETQVCSLAGFT